MLESEAWGVEVIACSALNKSLFVASAVFAVGSQASLIWGLQIYKDDCRGRSSPSDENAGLKNTGAGVRHSVCNRRCSFCSGRWLLREDTLRVAQRQRRGAVEVPFGFGDGQGSVRFRTPMGFAHSCGPREPLNVPIGSETGPLRAAGLSRRDGLELESDDTARQRDRERERGNRALAVESASRTRAEGIVAIARFVCVPSEWTAILLLPFQPWAKVVFSDDARVKNARRRVYVLMRALGRVCVFGKGKKRIFVEEKSRLRTARPARRRRVRDRERLLLGLGDRRESLRLEGRRFPCPQVRNETPVLGRGRWGFQDRGRS